MKLLEQNSISHNFDPSLDLHQREDEVLQLALQKLNFQPKKLMGKSSFWNTEFIGAIHYLGEYDGKDAVLKIQGVQMHSSEAEMIEAFEANNKSKIIRPPKLYAHLPWDEENRFETLVTEYIKAQTMISLPTTPEQVSEFFDIYAEYRANCRINPWVARPEDEVNKILDYNFEKWRQADLFMHRGDPRREKSDEQLIQDGIEVLKSNYRGVDLEFQHGHFSRGDVQKMDKEIILFSNLMWGWRMPFYDAVFAYHWFIYQLAEVASPSNDLIEEQRKIWLDKIYSLAHTEEDSKLIKLALLERALGGLRLDAFTIDPSNPVGKYLVESTRTQIRKLMKDLEYVQS